MNTGKYRSFKRDRFSFNLPRQLIAQQLAATANSTRLLILMRGANKIFHCHFKDFINFLSEGDLLVLNDSAVMPSRMWGLLDRGGQIEVTLVSRIKNNLWEALVRPNVGIKKNTHIFFLKTPVLRGKLLKKTPYGGWQITFTNRNHKFEDFLKKSADINIPFYIKRNVRLRECQNVYARAIGSMQPPTAGLHFTKKLLNAITAKGIDIAYITLHIGGSVLPLTVKDYDDFQMPKERFEVSGEVKVKIGRVRGRGKRVIAVGTTTVRALETVAKDDRTIEKGNGWTSLTIKPGYKFRVVDGFLTNFHLPGSSHLLLTSAFGGIKPVLSAYREAVRKKYKFLDFGDAMLMV